MDVKQRCATPGAAAPWNKGKLVGQKAPLRLGEIWAIRVRLELHGCVRDLALFNLAIDSKLRGCDLVQLKVQTSRKEVESGDVPSSCNKRRNNRSSSN